MAKTKQKKDTKLSKPKRTDPATATIIAARIGLIGTILVALIGLIDKVFPYIFAAQTQPSPAPTAILLTFTSTPPSPTNIALLPTLTPILPTQTPMDYAAFKDFTILKDGTILDTVRAGETTSVAAGTRLTIRANLTSNVAREDLFFIWTICSQPGSQMGGQSVSEILYQAPNAKETDCVRLMVKKGDIVLTNFVTISLNVH